MSTRRSRTTSILLLLIGSLALRLLLAYVIVPDSYISGDVDLYAYWAKLISDVGPGDFYAKASFADYPPGYLYVLWLIGEVGQSIAASAHTDAQSLILSLVRIPSMLLDVCAGLLLYLIARKWAVNGQDKERIGLIAAAIYLFNPVTWYDCAIWGQIDAVGACMMLLTVIAITQWSSEAAAVITVVAGLIKPQFGVVLVPIVGVVLWRRHLIRPENSPPSALFTSAYWQSRNGPIRILSSTAMAVIVFYALITPFNLDARLFLLLLTKTAGYYNSLSVNAYNPWALVGSGGTSPIAFASPETFGSPQSWSLDDIPLLGPVTGANIGTFLLGLGFLLGMARLLWRADRWSIVLVGAFLSMCFFMLPTRVHERYIFATFAFVSLLAAFDRKWLWATIALATASFMNLHGVFMMTTSDTDALHLPLSEFFRTTTGVVLSVVLYTAVFIFVIWRLHPKAVQFEVHWKDVGIREFHTVSHPTTSARSNDHLP
jgi:dolichyl-phosphate-mannose-protein mannosyltransferase